MRHLSDPMERLRAVNPVPATEAALELPDLVLFRRITTGAGVADPVVRPARRRRRARRLVPALAVASVLGGAAAYGLLRGEVSKPEKVACYELADLEAPTEVAFLDQRGPLAACADLWQRGELGEGGAVPQLTECVLDSGVVGVFPATSGPEVCRQLNLLPLHAPMPTSTAGSPAPSQPPPDVAAQFLAFRDSVATHFVDAPCVDPRAGAAIVRQELDRAGLTGWSVRGGEGLASDGFTAERPCATLSVRPEVREVVLVPFPRRPVGPGSG